MAKESGVSDLPANGWTSGPRCPGRVLAWRGRSTASYGDAVERALTAAAGGFDRILGEDAQADALAGDLLRLEPGQRRLVLRNARRYATFGVCQRLLDESLRRAVDDPAAARELAELGLALAERLELPAGATGLLADLQARAWACLANAHRAAADTSRATLAFDRAEARLAEGTGDPLAEAELLRLKALLAAGNGAWTAADDLLARESMIHQAAGHPYLHGRALLHRASLCARRGAFEEAVRLGRRAVDALASEAAPALLALACEQLARALAALGPGLEAQRWQAAARRYGRLAARAAPAGGAEPASAAAAVRPPPADPVEASFYLTVVG